MQHEAPNPYSSPRTSSTLVNLDQRADAHSSIGWFIASGVLVSWCCSFAPSGIQQGIDVLTASYVFSWLMPTMVSVAIGTLVYAGGNQTLARNINRRSRIVSAISFFAIMSICEALLNRVFQAPGLERVTLSFLVTLPVSYFGSIAANRILVSDHPYSREGMSPVAPRS